MDKENGRILEALNDPFFQMLGVLLREQHFWLFGLVSILPWDVWRKEKIMVVSNVSLTSLAGARCSDGCICAMR
jgi:hypothetical protein